MALTPLYGVLGSLCLVGGLSADDNAAQQGVRFLTRASATELPEVLPSMRHAAAIQPIASQSFMAPYGALYENPHPAQPLAGQLYRPLYNAQGSAQAPAEQPQPVVSLLAHGQVQPLSAQPWVDQSPEDFASYARGSQAAAFLAQDAASLSELLPSNARVSQLAALLSQDASALSYQLRVLEGDQGFTAFHGDGVQQDPQTSLLQYAASGNPNDVPRAELPHPPPQYEQHQLMQQPQKQQWQELQQYHKHDNWADSLVQTSRGSSGVYLGMRRQGLPAADGGKQFLG